MNNFIVKDDYKTILSNTGWLLIDKIVILLSNAILVFVVANHYGASEYGVFQYANSIVLILAVVVQLTDARVTKKRYKEDNFSYVVLNATVAKLFLSIVVFIIGGIILFVRDNQYPFTPIFLILLIDNIVKNVKFGMENRFEYLLQSKKVIIASDTSLIIGTILQVLAVYLGYSIVSISVIQLISTSIGLIILRIQYNVAFGKNNGKQTISVEFIKGIIIESLPLSIAAAAAVIYTKFDAVMLGTMMTSREVGIYSVASNLIRAVQLLIAPIQTSIYVKMLDWYNDKQKYDRYYLRISSLVTWIALIGIGFSFVLLPIIFRFLKDDYLPAIGSYMILSIGSVAAYNAILRSSHITIIEGGRYLMRIQWIAVVLNIILNYFFINMWGMNGAAIATATSQTVSLIFLNAIFSDTRYCLKMQVQAFNPKYGYELLRDVMLRKA